VRECVLEPSSSPRDAPRHFARAFLQAGAGAIASGLLSAFATKIIAISLGPASVALLSTLQQVQNAALSAATLNGQTALIQGASAFHGGQQRDYIFTVKSLFACATMLVTAILIAFPRMLSALAVLAEPALIRWLAVPVALLSAFTFLNALLRAAGEVARLAVIQVLASLTLAISAALAAHFRQSGFLVFMLVSASAISLIAAASIVRLPQAGRFSMPAARHFFSISGAMLATSLLASAVLLIIRSRITQGSGISSTGHFDAAWGISMNHVGLILAAMQVYYLPVLAGARDDESRRQHIASVLTMAILASAPVIVAIALLKPLVISLLYSSAFHPAADFLRWTLIGDYFKVTSWVLAIPMLAAADMRAFLLADFSTQAVFFTGAWLLGRVRGPAEAASIAFVLSYAVNFVICAVYARQRHGFRFGFRGAALWASGLTAVTAASFV
jgi:O-antigen/teichoic acid export membrane protein